MAHFAKVIDGYVTEVVVADEEFISSGQLGDPTNWIQTSYNTKGGVHLLGGEPLRKNYAGINYQYNEALDAFIPPKPYSSWILNESTCLWDAPIEMPKDGNHYEWNESSLSWMVIDIEKIKSLEQK